MSLALLDPRIQQRSCWQWQKHSDEVTHSESLSTNKSIASVMNFIYHREKEMTAAAGTQMDKNTEV